MGANSLIGGIFFKLGAKGANVLVEFEKKILIGGIFLKNLGAFFQIGGNGGKCVSGIWKKNLTGGIFLKIGGLFLSWGQKIILRSRKSAFWGIIWTPE